METILVVLIIGAVFVSTRRVSVTDEAYYCQVRKEMGIDPYSPAELKQMEAEERHTQQINHDACEFWGEAMLHNDGR